MTKKEFFNLLESAINGRKGFMIKYTSVNTIRVYSEDDIFTACFIGDVQENCGNWFNGITVDCEGKPYMSFNF